MNKIMCCYISPNGKECEKEAEFTVIYSNAPNDVTESCSCHIGELVDDNIGRFEVIRLNKEKEECSICHGEGATTDHHDPCSNCGGEGYIT